MRKSVGVYFPQGIQNDVKKTKKGCEMMELFVRLHV